MADLREIIETGLEHEDERVRAKYEWMRKQYNVGARACRAPEFLNTLEDADLFDSYSVMEDILPEA